MKKIMILFCQVLISVTSVAQSNQLYNFEPDIRIFTAYSFYNVGGFDHDWLKMDTMRIEIRNYLDSTLQINYIQEIENYVKNSNIDWGSCGIYALNLTNAPDFKWICDTCNLDLKNKFVGLDTLYRKFYINAEIESLWNKYKKKT